MNARIALLALAMTATAPAFAGSPISELADYTGLSERKVRMVLGNRTAFAEYRYTYDRSLAQFKRALGNDRYERLISGQPVELEGRGEVKLAVIPDSLR